MNRVAYSKSLAHPRPSPFVSLHVRLIYLFLAIFFSLSVCIVVVHSSPDHKIFREERRWKKPGRVELHRAIDQSNSHA